MCLQPLAIYGIEALVLFVRGSIDPQVWPRAYAKRATSSCSTLTIFSSELTGMNSFTPWQQ